MAKLLNLPVQDSSRVLNKYFEDNRKLNAHLLTGTYILTGTLKSDQGKAVCLVKDSDIKSKKKEFEEILSEILYSVQKTKDIDFNVLALVDWPNLTISEGKPKPL